MHSYSISFHKHPDTDEVGSQARSNRCRKEALKEGQLGRGTREGFLEEEVCQLGQEGGGKRGRNECMGRRVGAPQRQSTLPKQQLTGTLGWRAPSHLHLAAQVFGSMVIELEASMSTKTLCWTCYCQG